MPRRNDKGRGPVTRRGFPRKRDEGSFWERSTMRQLQQSRPSEDAKKERQ